MIDREPGISLRMIGKALHKGATQRHVTGNSNVVDLVGMLLHISAFAIHGPALNTADAYLAGQPSILDRDTLLRQNRPGGRNTLCSCSGKD